MSNKSVTDVDRLAARGKPDGAPIMHQNWASFILYWRINEEILRPHIPANHSVYHVGRSRFSTINSGPAWIQFYAGTECAHLLRQRLSH
jgi:hypothetical protein